jgi:hypothetical protein
MCNFCNLLKPLWGMDEIMEITDKTLRRLLKVSHAEFNRVDAIRREIMLDKNAAKRRAMFYIDNGYLPPETPLPPLPEFPPECRGIPAHRESMPKQDALHKRALQMAWWTFDRPQDSCGQSSEFGKPKARPEVIGAAKSQHLGGLG